ncbi:MAG TPA: DUF3040 domain-containing protein [Jatrophihabitans sp.]|nr:DUF3040 domain-containing protein [Jatrophihabitans sp.]
MALSEYERRVLNEIETDLSQTGYRRWLCWLRNLPRHARVLVRRRWRLSIATLLWLAACVVAGLLAPAPVAAAAASVAGFVLGWLWGNRARLGRWGRG